MPTQNKSKYTIAVIEDNPEIRASLVELLELNEFFVHAAEDGLKGLALIKRVMPDVVLCDIMMPAMDGLELLEELRKDPELLHTPLIFVTAKVAVQDKMKGLEIGANDYITKPFDFKELLLKINNMIELRNNTLNLAYSKPQKLDVISKDDRFIIALNAIIEEHINDVELGLTALAKELNISKSSLQKKLKRITDKSVSQYLREFRLERAKDLIEADFGTLKEISVKAGFKNVSYFSNCFKAYFGETPKNFNR